MNHWDYFLFLFHQGLGFIISNSLLIIPSILGLIYLLYRNFKINGVPFKRVYLISLIPFLFPMLMLLWGTFFEHTQTYSANIPNWQSNVLSGMLFLQVAINLACLFYFKGIRLLVVMLALIQLSFTLPFFLVASMSVGGIWL
jgi:hypothetical protein